MRRGRSAVFLDRDGVLNEVVERNGRAESPRSLAEFRIVRAAAGAVTRLREAGLPVFVVTNQPDLARGLLAPETLAAMTAGLMDLGVTEVRVCPHDDADGCACRKPRPGMLLDLAGAHGLDLASCYLVGDTWRDMAAGRAAGCCTVLLRQPYNDGVRGDAGAQTLDSAVDVILAWHAAGHGGTGPAGAVA